MNGTTQAGPDLERAIRDYVRAYVRRHGRRKTAGDLGVSRHTLWRFLERGHVGRAVPSAVLNAVGGNTAAFEAATLEIIIDLEGLRPDPALRPLPKGLEEALLLLCATPLATVDELTRFGRVPASTLRDRLEKLAKRCLVDSMAYHLSVLGARPQRRYFPTEKGVTTGGAATKGRAHMLRTYPVSKQWFRLLAERLDAVAVLYRVAALVADSDPHNDSVRVDHYRQGPYDMLLTLSGGRSIGLLRQGPVLPTSNLRYRLRSIKRLHSSETPFVTFVLTHADQATRRAIRSLGDPSEHRRTFVATEGETLAGDAKAVVWQQSGSGLGDDPPVRVSPDASLPGIMAWAERLLDSSYPFLRDNPKPNPGGLYLSSVQAAMPEPTDQLIAALAVQLTRADKERSRLALSCSLELGDLLMQLFLGRRQLRNLPLQLRDQPHQLVTLRGREVFGLTHSQSIKTCSVPHNPLPTPIPLINYLWLIKSMAWIGASVAIFVPLLAWNILKLARRERSIDEQLRMAVENAVWVDDQIKSFLHNALSNPWYGVAKCYAFGSIVGRYPTRDVDVVIQFDSSKQGRVRICRERLRSIESSFQEFHCLKLHVQT